MKKLLLSLGTVAAIAAPVASVIACGSVASLPNESTNNPLANKAIKIIHSWNEYQKINGLDEIGGGSQPGQMGPSGQFPVSHDKSVTYLVSAQSQDTPAPTSGQVVHTGSKYDARTRIKASELDANKAAIPGYKKAVKKTQGIMKQSISMVQYIFDHLSDPRAKEMMPQIGEHVGPILEDMSNDNFSALDPKNEMPKTTAFIKESIIKPLMKIRKQNATQGFGDVFKSLLDASIEKGSIKEAIPADVLTENDNASIMIFPVDKNDQNSDWFEVSADMSDYSNILTNTYDLKLYFIYTIVEIVMDSSQGPSQGQGQTPNSLTQP